MKTRIPVDLYIKQKEKQIERKMDKWHGNRPLTSQKESVRLSAMALRSIRDINLGCYNKLLLY